MHAAPCPQDPRYLPFNAFFGSDPSFHPTGDLITIDAEVNSIRVDVSDDEMARRRAAWTMPAYKERRGTLYKYIKNVSDASHGCVTDE